MKKYPLYIALASATLLSACSKELEQYPSTSLPTETAVTSLEDLDKAVNGAYSPLSGRRYSYSSEVALYADARGGDIYAPNTAYNQSLSIQQLSTTRTSGFSAGTYQTFSTVLGRVNDILPKAADVASTLTSNASEQAAYQNLVGQLYALRALAHFELVRIFSYLPTSGVNIQAAYSGIPLNIEQYPLNHRFQRSTLAETYEQIVKDFLQARQGLTKEKTLRSGKLNYWAATALLARAYLYLGDWQNAYTYAVEVIDQSPYRLYERSDYTSVWDKQGTDESLFENLVTEKQNTGLTSIGNYTRPSGYPEFAAGEDFVRWVQAGHTGDIRVETIQEADYQGKNKAYYTTKYPGQAGSSNPAAMNNFKIIRLSEVYLIAAEAQLKGATATNGHTAVALYNALRQKRISPYTPASSVTLDELLDERRLELFCEGHRYFDLARNQRNVPTQYVPGATEVQPTDARLVSELPERERNINPELVLDARK